MTRKGSTIRTVSVGMPQDIDFGGQVFRSAILKHPVSGPVAVTKAGVAGNKPAVHPDAIYAFSAESYTYWTDKLGVEADAWPDGFVGENLTVCGLDEQTLALGDVIAVGDQVRLQVLGPRIPCFKLSWRLGQPEAFLRDFALSGRCGYYLKVLQEGNIESGDEVRVVQQEEDRILLTHISRLIFGGEEASEEALARVLASPFLSETSALMLRGQRVRLQEKAETRRGRWQGWRPFVVERVADEALGIRSFYLAPKDGGGLAGYLPGQFLTLRLTDGKGESLIRTYSLSDYGREDGLYRISVKRQGAMSNLLHDTVTPGAVVDVRSPAGVFTLDRTRLEPAVLISAGIGITPLLSMAKAHADRGAEAPALHFIHCARDSASRALRDEVATVCARSGKFHQYDLLEEVSETDREGVDFHAIGRLDIGQLERILGETFVEYCGVRIDIPFTHALFYICGPAAFQQGLVTALQAAGAPAHHIRTEAFVAGEGGAVGDAVDTAEVVLTRSGRSLVWSDEEGLTLLELLERGGVEADFGCRNGMCQACKCGVSAGAVRYDHAPVTMPEEGTALLCCAKPGSARLELDL